MTASRVRLAAVAAVAAAVVVAAALVFAGGADGDDGRLSWAGKVRVFDSSIATDKVLTGRLENSSLRDLSLDVEDVVVRDASGGEVQSSVRFIEAFVHGIFPWSQRPEVLGDFERRRLGEIVTLKPGQSAPVALSWRVRKGGREPVRVDFGPASLELPTR